MRCAARRPVCEPPGRRMRHDLGPAGREQRHDDDGRRRRPAAQPRVDGLDAVAFPSTQPRLGGGTGRDHRHDRRRRDLDAAVHGAGRHPGARSSPTSGTAWAVAADSLLRTTDGGAGWSAAAEPAGLRADERHVHERRRGLGQSRSRPGASAGRGWERSCTRDDGGSSWSVVDPHVADSICVSGGELVAGAGFEGAATRPTAARRGAPCSTRRATPSPSGSRRRSSAPTSSRSGCCSRAAWRPAARATRRTRAPTPASAGSRSSWRRCWSDPTRRFANVTPLDAYPGPFAAVSASEAIFLGQCPACNPQHVTVLRTRDGGARWDRRVVNGFFPTGLSFADPGHGWMTTLIGGQEGRRSAILATTDGGRSWRPVFPS